MRFKESIVSSEPSNRDQAEVLRQELMDEVSQIVHREVLELSLPM
jgi:hypothetical protein